MFVQVHQPDRLYYNKSKYQKASDKKRACELAASATGDVEQENSMTVSNSRISFNDRFTSKAEEYCEKMVDSDNLIHCKDKDMSKIRPTSIRNQVKNIMKILKRKPSKEKKRKRRTAKEMDRQRRKNIKRSRQIRKKRPGNEKGKQSKEKHYKH